MIFLLCLFDINTLSATSDSTVFYCKTTPFLEHTIFLDQQRHRQVLNKNIQNTFISNLLMALFGHNMWCGVNKMVFYSKLDL
jgi:hypothetical protein